MRDGGEGLGGAELVSAGFVDDASEGLEVIRRLLHSVDRTSELIIFLGSLRAKQLEVTLLEIHRKQFFGLPRKSLPVEI